MSVNFVMDDEPAGKPANGKSPTGQRLELPEVAPTPILRWQPFPVASLPDVLRTCVLETASAIGCDPSMVALPALAVCAAAIGTTRRVRLKKTWTEPSVLWCVVVARSGSMKSPALDYALAPLTSVQSAEFKTYNDQLDQHERNKQEYEAALVDWRRDKKRGDMPEKPEAPVPVRFVVSDCTVESIAPILASNPRGVLLARDELSGWFGSFNQYKAGKGGDVPNWLEMQRAGTVTVDRKTGVRMIHIPRAAVSICGTIQPQTLRRQLTDEFFDCGLSARLLLAMPPIRTKRWTEADIPERTQERYAETLDRLLALQHETSDDGQLAPINVNLSSDALPIWAAWVNECGELQANAEDDRTAAAIAKTEGYAARLALVCQLVRNPESTVIDAEAVLAGITIARWFARESERAYGLWNENPENRECRELVDWIERHGGSTTVRELRNGWRRYRNNPSGAMDGLEQLVRAGRGDWESGGGGKPGAPSKRFRLFDLASDNSVYVYESPRGATENVGFVDVDTVDTCVSAIDDGPPIDPERADALGAEVDTSQEWGECETGTQLT